MDKATVDIIQGGISLSEWFEKVNHKDSTKLREEDNDKRERLKQIAKVINLPYDVPAQFSAQEIAAQSTKFAKYLKEHGRELCALRLIPLDNSLPKLRIRGLSLEDSLKWFTKQSIDPSNYRADIIPHSNSEEWSTIFVINDKGIYGEILKGKPIELTHGVFFNAQPLTFAYEQDRWNLSEENKEALAHLKSIMKLLKVTNPQKQLALKKSVGIEFADNYIKGYFETVQTREFGLWFVDYNRLLGELYADFHIKQTHSHTNEVLLKGNTGSRGIVTGKVRIVMETDLQNTGFKVGEILVTHFTSPDFVPLMTKAAGIITDMGGVLSHASIIARELKLPCLVGTRPNATTILKTGDTIELDADNGQVRLINPQLIRELYFAQKALILDRTKQKLLVSKFKSAKYLPIKLTGKLCLPGGRIKHGESLEQGFFREIEEEVGVMVSYGLPLSSWTWIYRKQDKLVQIVANAIICEYVSGEISETPIAPSGEIEYEKARWIKLNEIKLEDFVEDERPAIALCLKQYLQK